MNKQQPKISIILTIIAMLYALNGYSQNTNLDSLLNANQWNALFPKRAGIAGGHPQGYKTDFYSFNNLKQAAAEMSDYLVKIRVKNGLSSQLITITRKSTNTTYNYSDVGASWYSSSIPETIVTIDFEDFANTSSDYNNKRELAAFLANISKESTGGWTMPVGGGQSGDYAKWGLYFVYEVGYNSTNAAGAYAVASSEFPANPSVGYYGRGPMQLSYNFNYGQLSKFLFNDKNVLLNDPDSIQRNGVLAFKSGIWFWMMPQCPKPSCHQVMHDLWTPSAGYTSSKMYKKGFAHTNNIINGALECRSTSTTLFTDKVVLRSELYKYYLNILGFNSSQISLENTSDYSTLCYESSTNVMQNYSNCSLSVTTNTPSVQEIDTQNTTIFPNPAKDVVEVTHFRKIDKAELVNTVGQVVKVSMHHSNQIELNTSDLSPGYFIIRLYSESAIYTKSLVVR
jgi:hypothetical protein